MARRSPAATTADAATFDSPAQPEVLGSGTADMEIDKQPEASPSVSEPTDIWSEEMPVMKAKMAGRWLARTIDEHEHEALRKQRAALAVRSARGDASEADERRRRVIEWELDRIEDARHGPELDRYDAIAETFRQLGQELQHVTRNLPKRK